MSYNDDIEKFAIRIKNGGSMETPEDLQFYLNHREEIEKILKDFSGKDAIMKNSQEMKTPEDLQFYLKHRNDIEKLLKYFSSKRQYIQMKLF